MKCYAHIILLATIVVSATFTTFSYSQKSDISFSHITIDDGLSQSSILCMMQDKDGFMWFGTQGGLNRYNGTSSKPFDVYLHNIYDTNSLSSSWIFAISEDNSGNLWIGTVSGLNKFDKKNNKFTRYLNNPQNPESISDGQVFGVLVDSRGNVWAKTFDALNKLDTATGKFVRFVHDVDFFQSKSLDLSFPIIEDKHGKLWTGSQDGLLLFDRDYETYKKYTVNNSAICDNFVSAIYEDKEGYLWIGTKNGLNRFNYKKNEFITFRHEPGNENSLCNNNVKTICQDHLGNIWIGTYGGGVSRYNPKTKTFTNFTTNANDLANSLSNPYIISIYEDRSHILWIGSYGKAINKVDLKNKKFNLYTQFNIGLSFNEIAAVYETDDNKLWIGTWGKGLNIYDKKTGQIELISTNTGKLRSLKSDHIFEIFKDSRGLIWIGTKNGINIYNKEEDKFYPLSHYITNNIDARVNEIIEDKNHNIWIATNGAGLHKIDFEQKTVVKFNTSTENKESLSDNQIYALIEDSEGFIWVGTGGGGLNRYNPVTGVFKRFVNDVRKQNTISNNKVFDIYEDSEGYLWIATESGLNKFNKKDTTFTIYTKEANGLPNDLIYNIIEDNNKNLWMSTGYGIAMFDKKNNIFKSYDKADGLGSLELNFGSVYKSKSGEIFFGGTGGLNSFYPDSIYINPFEPSVVFLRYEKTNNNGIFTTPLENVEEIELEYTDHTLTIYFAALEFTNPRKNKYKYKLIGYRDEWVDIGNQDFRTFSNLPAGEYVLNVIGSNNDLVWNEKGASLRIIVHPPYWQTSWAYVTYVLLLVLGVYNIIRVRTKKLKTANQTLRTKQMAALEIARQKEELTIKNKSITDSINYAKRIQEAMMPSEFLFKKLLPQSFILYKPKDIVSGDFYWIAEKNNKIFIAAVDCTGHGVPGAFMSIIGFDLLRNITKEQGVENPAQILNQLNNGVSETFSKNMNETQVKDGMDVSLCVIDKNLKQLEYAGAMNPLYIVRDNKIIAIKGNRFSVGTISESSEEQKFESHVFPYKEDDMVYMFSDGYPDQFGGPIGKKFKFRRFRHLLLTINKLSMDKQQKFLDENIENWKGELEQVDDILIIGFRL